jgi:hypothetical protein
VAEAQQLLERDAATGVYVDGGRVLTDFLRHDLVDELTVTRVPVLLGYRRPLFHGLPREIRLIHRGTVCTDDGPSARATWSPVNPPADEGGVSCEVGLVGRWHGKVSDVPRFRGCLRPSIVPDRRVSPSKSTDKGTSA